MENFKATFVIIGSGIAGVSCAESLAFLAPKEKIILITASHLIKAITNVVPLGKNLTQFDIEERSPSSLIELYPSISVINDSVINVNAKKKMIVTETGQVVTFKKLCICTGARPKLICSNNERVIGIRDTESVENFLIKLAGAKKIIVVGNGGIATELVHEISGVEVLWVIKDKHISATFVDPGAAEFFQEKLSKEDIKPEKQHTRRMKYTITCDKSIKGGPALGPDWHNNFKLKESKAYGKVVIEYECEILDVLDASETLDYVEKDWPVYARLSNGQVVGCDIIVSATGVIPNSNLSGLSLDKDINGGYTVDWKMETSQKDIYAAGDVCSVGWDVAKHWFQMRLWTQAHQMGRYAAKSMVSDFKGEEFYQDFCFECFTHVTNFFGYKVILLGLYNGQKLDNDYEILLRVTKGKEYIKLIMSDNRMQGALLIGETDLAEMCENLILNQLDLSPYGEDLLNPDIDIEDYFD